MENFTPRERVMIAFEHQEADRVSLTELLIDPHIIDFILGTDYKASSGPMYDSICQIKAAMKMGLDLLPLWPQKSEKIKCINENTYADEFGRIWSTSNTDSFMDNYSGGGIKDVNDFKEYKLEPMLEERLPLEMLKAIFKNYPDYSFMMCHAGPYELTFESLGIENFCYKLYDDRQFIRKILEDRTDWFIELAIHAINAGG